MNPQWNTVLAMPIMAPNRCFDGLNFMLERYYMRTIKKAEIVGTARCYTWRPWRKSSRSLKNIGADQE